MTVRLTWHAADSFGSSGFDSASTSHTKTGALLWIHRLYLMIATVIAAALIFAYVKGSQFRNETPKTINQPIFKKAPNLGKPKADWSADLVDRNGVLLARSVETINFKIRPRAIIGDRTRNSISDRSRLIKEVAAIIPDVSMKTLTHAFNNHDAPAVYIKRNITEGQKQALERLGELQGFELEKKIRRFYPNKEVGIHARGYYRSGKNGIGIEQALSDRLQNPDMRSNPLAMSIDIRAQSAVGDILEDALTNYEATGAAAVVLDVQTGEVLTLSSKPEFDLEKYDPNSPAQQNLVTYNTYEYGSVFKVFTIANALEYQLTSLDQTWNANKLKIDGFSIRDKPKCKDLMTISQIIINSCNRATARIALNLPENAQRNFFKTLGFFEPSPIEINEVGIPKGGESQWSRSKVITTSYGHGIQVSLLQTASAFAAMVNGGRLIPPTLIARDKQSPPIKTSQVLSEKTSLIIRNLMRLNVVHGTGRKGEVAGYLLGGKTGTSEIGGQGGYDQERVRSTFIGAFPMNRPRYVIAVSIHEPKKTDLNRGNRSASWVAAPVVNRVLRKIAPILGILPQQEKMDLGKVKKYAYIRD